MPEREWQRLDRVVEQAQDLGDQRTASRLIQLLDDADDLNGSSDRGGRSGNEGSGLPAALKGIGPETIEMLLLESIKMSGLDEFLRMAKLKLGPGFFEEIRRNTPGGRQQQAQALAKVMAADLASEVALEILPPKRQPPKTARGQSADPFQPDFFNE